MVEILAFGEVLREQVGDILVYARKSTVRSSALGFQVQPVVEIHLMHLSLLPIAFIVPPILGDVTPTEAV
jgi:hypothetical protein